MKKEKIELIEKKTREFFKNAGIVVGSGLNFNPLSDITRGEAAVLVYRAFNERMEAVQ